MGDLIGNKCVLIMDTSVLLCYFEYLGYRVKGGQCRAKVVAQFKDTVCANRRKMNLEECASQLEIILHRSFPGVFYRGRRLSSSNTAKPTLTVTEGSDPAKIFTRMHKLLKNDFGQISSSIPQKDKRQMRKDIRSHLRSRYVSNPTSAESRRWISKKRSSLPPDLYAKTRRGMSDNNREVLEYIVRMMSKGKDLDMLVHTLFAVEENPDMKALFVSEDSDHLACREYLSDRTDERMQVLTISDAVAAGQEEGRTGSTNRDH